MRYFILPFLAALLAPTNVNAGNWARIARSDNGYKSKEVGISKKDQLDINMKAMHGIFILPAKDGTSKDKKES